MQKIYGLTAILLVAACVNSSAQIGYFFDGGRRPLTARALAMGDAYAAVVNDASALSWNPGALGGLKRFSLVFTASGQGDQGTLKEKKEGSVQYFKSVQMKERAFRLGLNQVSMAFPIDVDSWNDLRITPAVSFHQVSNFRGQTEKWVINYSDANWDAKQTITRDIKGGMNALSFGLGVDISEVFGFGMSVNRIFGKRTGYVKNESDLTGVNKILSEDTFSTKYSGWQLGYGILLHGEKFRMALTASLPSYRKIEDLDSIGTVSMYVRDPFSFQAGISIGKKNKNVFSLQFGYANLSKDYVFLENTPYNLGPSMNNLNRININAGLELGGTDGAFRAGINYKNYALKNSEGKQVSSLGLSLGFGGGEDVLFDAGMRLDLYTWEDVVFYPNGSFLNYTGPTIMIYTTLTINGKEK